MYPSSILRQPPAIRIAYFGGVALALAVWMLPLIAVALISIRSVDDLNRGFVWGWPADVRAVENYLTVIGGSREIRFMLNSFLIAVPSVIGTVLLSSMAGF